MNSRSVVGLLLIVAFVALTGCGAGDPSPKLTTEETCNEIQTILRKHEFDWTAAEDDLRELAKQASSATSDGLEAMIDSMGDSADTEALGDVCYG